MLLLPLNSHKLIQKAKKINPSTKWLRIFLYITPKCRSPLIHTHTQYDKKKFCFLTQNFSEFSFPFSQKQYYIITLTLGIYFFYFFLRTLLLNEWTNHPQIIFINEKQKKLNNRKWNDIISFTSSSSGLKRFYLSFVLLKTQKQCQKTYSYHFLTSLLYFFFKDIKQNK